MISLSFMTLPQADQHNFPFLCLCYVQSLIGSTFIARSKDTAGKMKEGRKAGREDRRIEGREEARKGGKEEGEERRKGREGDSREKDGGREGGREEAHSSQSSRASWKER